jgi:hypothetical protein
MKKFVATLILVLVSVVLTVIITAPIVYLVMHKQSYDQQGILKRRITDLEFELSAKGNPLMTTDAEKAAEATGVKQFRNTALRLQLSYPTEWSKPADIEPSDTTTITFNKGNQYVCIIRIDSGESATTNVGDVFFGATKSGQNAFPAGAADEFLFPNGYSDGNQSTPPYVVERMVYSGRLYAFEFYGEAKLTDEAKALMDSVRFID